VNGGGTTKLSENRGVRRTGTGVGRNGVEQGNMWELKIVTQKNGKGRKKARRVRKQRESSNKTRKEQREKTADLGKA